MLALSMVVITGLIGAPGLGRSLTNALSKVNVGAAFEAGIAIVILAIILDRLTFAAGEWLDPRVRRAQHRPGGRIVAIGAPILILGAGLLAPLVVDATSFPDAISVSVQDPVNAFVGLGDGHVLGRSRSRSRTSITNCRAQPAPDAADERAVVARHRRRRRWSRGSCPVAGRRSSPRSASA